MTSPLDDAKLVERLREAARKGGTSNLLTARRWSLLFTEAADRLSSVLEATGYAERLAVALWEKHYKQINLHWRPLSGDLIGILTQIDNMTVGLSRAALDPIKPDEK